VVSASFHSEKLLLSRELLPRYPDYDQYTYTYVHLVLKACLHTYMYVCEHAPSLDADLRVHIHLVLIPFCSLLSGLRVSVRVTWLNDENVLYGCDGILGCCWYIWCNVSTWSDSEKWFAGWRMEV
jgi:hypothetical protein